MNIRFGNQDIMTTHEWQQNGYTHQEVINKEQFTRQHEAQQFEKLFLQCIQ